MLGEKEEGGGGSGTNEKRRKGIETQRQCRVKVSEERRKDPVNTRKGKGRTQRKEMIKENDTNSRRK